MMPEEDTMKLKSISSVIDDQPVLSKDLLDLSRLLSKTCFCSLFDSVKAMLPPGLGYSVEKRYFYLDDDGVTDETEQKILDYLKKKKKGATQSEILSKLFLAVTEPFEKLTAEGHLSVKEVSKRKVGDACPGSSSQKKTFRKTAGGFKIPGRNRRTKL